MKKILAVLVIALAFGNVQVYAQNNTTGKDFTYTGSNWDRYNGHSAEIVVQDTVVGGLKLIGKAIVEDGEFRISGEKRHPENGWFGLYNPDGDRSWTWGR